MVGGRLCCWTGAGGRSAAASDPEGAERAPGARRPRPDQRDDPAGTGFALPLGSLLECIRPLHGRFEPAGRARFAPSTSPQIERPTTSGAVEPRLLLCITAPAVSTHPSLRPPASSAPG